MNKSQWADPLKWPSQGWSSNTSGPHSFCFIDCVINTNRGVVSWPVLSLVPLHITREVVQFDESNGIWTPTMRSKRFHHGLRLDVGYNVEWNFMTNQQLNLAALISKLKNCHSSALLIQPYKNRQQMKISTFIIC